MLVAIEGIDGSGKGTQAEILRQRLTSDGTSAVVISFPRYSDTRFGAAIGDYLNGKLGSLEHVHPLLASLLFAGDRFESLSVLQSAAEQEDVVILDRYVASNIAHQGARCSAEEAPRVMQFIEEVEHDVFGLPRADVTILLDISVRTAVELIHRKNPRSYTDQAADLHEADSAYLQSVRDVYLQLSRAQTGWHVVPVEKDGALRTIDDIAAEIHGIVTQQIANG